MSACPTENADHSLRVLVVENHPDTLKYLARYLRAMGHQVEAAHDLNEALALLPESDCDVLISDIGLPDGTGWELLERARLEKPIYAIAMSGLNQNSDRARSQAAGFRHYLLKPFAPEELDAMLEEAARELGRSRPPG